MRQMQLTARSYHRVLKLARTIADLAGASSIEPPHLAEALNFRTKMDLNRCHYFINICL
jgi:magnesium chelatase family protein